MRESRTYGSGRGACHEMHVPTATDGASSSRCSVVRSPRFIVQAHRRKKDITGQATINGIKASTRRSKEMTAKARAAT